MVRAKISAFMERQDTVYRRYPLSNDSLPARYARAIATYRHGDLRSAIAQIDALIQQQPANPYFYELRGQALLEGGKPAGGDRAAAQGGATVEQRAAHRDVTWAGAGGDRIITPTPTKRSRFCARRVARETEAPIGYTQLAMAYGRKGDYAQADLASAQAAYLARRQQDRARSGVAGQNPVRDRYAGMGQGRRHRLRQAAARPEEQLEISNFGYNRNLATT